MKTKRNAVSKDASANQRDGFTLLELLVIIGLLALLATIQVSAYAGAKERTRKTVCASNVRKLTMALQVYGGDNGNKLPLISGSVAWAWDMPTNVADVLLSYGLHRRDFYCPSTAPRYTDWENFLDPTPQQNLWSFNSSVHIVGYMFALSGPSCRIAITNQNTTLQAETIRTGTSSSLAAPPSSERELVADAILSQPGQNNAAQRLTGNYNYDDIAGGFYKTHTSAHLIRGIPEGSNIGFKDGHVAWRKFSSPLVNARTTGGSAPVFWW